MIAEGNGIKSYGKMYQSLIHCFGHEEKGGEGVNTFLAPKKGEGLREDLQCDCNVIEDLQCT